MKGNCNFSCVHKFYIKLKFTLYLCLGFVSCLLMWMDIQHFITLVGGGTMTLLNNCLKSMQTKLHSKLWHAIALSK